MRGKDKTAVQPISQHGITPAYAGKSSPLVRAYPPISGSPPPMRGKASGVKANHKTPGITPAYAGKSYPLRVTRR